MLFGVIASSTTYTTILICSRRILECLKTQSNFMTTRTKQMHNVLNQMLFAQVSYFCLLCSDFNSNHRRFQTIIPIVIAAVPSMTCVISLGLGYAPSKFSVLISIILSWCPSVGPACTIFYVPSYKKRLFSCMRGQFNVRPVDKSSFQTPSIGLLNTQGNVATVSQNC